MKLKRDPIKYVRDRAKAQYEKAAACFICGDATELDFHHYKTVSLLIHQYMETNKLEPEDVIDWRDSFIESHHKELYEEAVTLCHTHHLKLHSIYGRNPPLSMAKKQEKWVNIQREKACLGSTT